MDLWFFLNQVCTAFSFFSGVIDSMSPMLSIEHELYCIFFELHSFNVENAGYMLQNFFYPLFSCLHKHKEPWWSWSHQTSHKETICSSRGPWRSDWGKEDSIVFKKQTFSCSDYLGGCRPNNSLYVLRQIFHKFTLLTTFKDLLLHHEWSGIYYYNTRWRAVRSHFGLIPRIQSKILCCCHIL